MVNHGRNLSAPIGEREMAGRGERLEGWNWNGLSFGLVRERLTRVPTSRGGMNGPGCSIMTPSALVEESLYL